MKKLSLLFVMLITAFACSEENSKADFVNPYEYVGVEHNKSLDIVFAKFNDLRASNPKATLQDFLNVAEQSSVDYTFSTANLNTKGSLFVKDHCKEMNRVLYGYAATTTYATFQDRMIADVQHLMTGNQKSYVNQILTIVSSDESLENNLLRLKSLEKEVNRKCNEDEKGMLLSSIAVAKHSIQYWNTNFIKWDNAFKINANNQSAKTMGEIKPGWVAGADVGGAVGVGVVTSTALCVPFIGWGAWCAGVVAGAVVSSAGAAIIMWASYPGYSVVDNSDGPITNINVTPSMMLPYGATLTTNDYLRKTF